MVLGHTSCCAIICACNNVRMGHITGLVAKIKPTINKANQHFYHNQCTHSNFINEIAKDNVRWVIKNISKQSRVIQKRVTENKVAIVGGIYNISTGQVEFLK